MHELDLVVKDGMVVPAVYVNLYGGWVGILVGVVSGSVIGIFFHDDGWLGGYAAFRRRMVRLGHIAFIGLGLVNIAFALSAVPLGLEPPRLAVASAGFLVGAVTMPLCCFLAAWRKALGLLFPIPVLGVLVGVASLLLGARFP